MSIELLYLFVRFWGLLERTIIIQKGNLFNSLTRDLWTHEISPLACCSVESACNAVIRCLRYLFCLNLFSYFNRL